MSLSTALSRHYMAFTVVFFVVLILLTLYCVLAPESEKFNVSPFPMLSPTDLPDNKIQGSTCYDTLTPCDATGQCSKCTSEFTCTYVSDSSNYVFNGTKVSEGDWCLPAVGQNTTCNSYTGQWLWTSDASGQSWKCDCLYPDLFSGPDCGTQVACVNEFLENFRENSDGPQDQSGNKLVATQAIKVNEQITIPAGTAWDPFVDPLAYPDTQNALEHVNPLAKNADGSPMFKCLCQTSSNGDLENFIPTISLPNDPYHCHLDPCLSQVYADNAGFYQYKTCIAEDCTTDVAKASCDCTAIDYSQVPSGPATGLCQDEDYACKLTYDNGDYHMGQYDKATNQCLCSDSKGPFGTPRDCSVHPTGLEKQCMQSTNLFGKECYSECADITFRNPKDNEPACAQCHSVPKVCQYYPNVDPAQGNYTCGNIVSTDKTHDWVGCCSATGPIVDDAIGIARETTLGGFQENCTKKYWPVNSVVAFQPIQCPCSADTDNIQIAQDILDMSKFSCTNNGLATQCQFNGNDEFSKEMDNNIGLTWSSMNKDNQGGSLKINNGLNEKSGNSTSDNIPCARDLQLFHLNHGYDIGNTGITKFDSRWGIVCTADSNPGSTDQSVKDNTGDQQDNHLTGLNVNKRDDQVPKLWYCGFNGNC